MERILRIVDEVQAHGATFTIAETAYEFGRHFVIYINGVPDFHSKELERVRNYMRMWTSLGAKS